MHEQKGDAEKGHKDTVLRRTFDGDTMTLVRGARRQIQQRFTSDDTRLRLRVGFGTAKRFLA